MIKAFDAAQGDPSPESSGAVIAAGADPARPELVERVKTAESASSADIPLLSLEEKRRILARIVRTNALDCFDDAGTFDIVRARQVLPPGAVRHIDIDETTRIDAEGQPITQRRIRLRLVDPLSALRLDDQLERRREPTVSGFHSNSHSASNPSSGTSFNPPAEKTPASDDANPSIEKLKQALVEAKDRELHLYKQLTFQDQRLQTLQSKWEMARASSNQSSGSPDDPREAGISTLPGSMALWSRVHEAQGNTGCEPVDPKPRAPSPPHAQSPSSTAHQRRDQKPPRKSLADLPYHELPRREQEIEERRSTSSPTAFAAWLKATAEEPPGFRTGAPRPPPEYEPMSVANQGRCRIIE